MTPDSIYAYEYVNDVENDEYPDLNHLVHETDDGIYFVPQSNTRLWLRTTDKGLTITTAYTGPSGAIIQSSVYDKANDAIFFWESDSPAWGRILMRLDLPGHTTAQITNPGDEPTLDPFSDVILAGGTFRDLIIIQLTDAGAPSGDRKVQGTKIVLDVNLDFSSSASLFFKNMGAFAARTSDMNRYILTLNNTTVWYLWKWSNEDTKLFENGTERASIPGTTLINDFNFKGISYDGSDKFFFVLNKGGTNTLYSYSISNDTITEGGAYDISLMLERNTDSTNNPPFNLEKGIHLTERIVYQITKSKGNVNSIADLEDAVADGTIVAITDSYLFILRASTDVEIWEYLDQMDKIVNFMNAKHAERDFPTFEFIARKELAEQFPRDTFVQIIGEYSRGGSTTTSVIMEGIVDSRDLQSNKKFWIESLGREIDSIEPDPLTDFGSAYITANYDGKTSGGILTQLINDYCDYCAPGTISAGIVTWDVPGDLDMKGDKSLRIIWNQLADAELFSWSLRTQGEIDFDANSVSTGVTFSSTDTIAPTRPTKGKELSQKINKIILHGAIIAGVRVGPVTADNTASQQIHGVIKWAKTYAGVEDATILQTIADNKLIIQGAGPLRIQIERRDLVDGFIQVRETIIVGAGIPIDNVDNTVPAGTYIVNEIHHNPKDGISDLVIADGTLFIEDARHTLPEENHQQILQNSGELIDMKSGGSSMCRIATGTYTGNAANNRQITGFGFTPKLLIIGYIWSDTNMYQQLTNEDIAAWTSYYVDHANVAFSDHMTIISDGFEVNNNDAGDEVNTSGITYYYYAWG